MKLFKSRPGNEYGQRWSALEVFRIPSAADPEVTYLKRLRIVQTPWFGLYLHWIYLADDDRDPHDHPWNFWSLIVRGGYLEHIYSERNTKPKLVYRRRFSLHRHPTTIAHTIAALKPGTITLVLSGRRRRDWGFWTEAGFVPWREYDRSGT